MYRCWITRVIELFPGGKQEIVMLSFRSLGEGCSRWSNHSIEHQGHHFLLRMNSVIVDHSSPVRIRASFILLLHESTRSLD